MNKKLKILFFCMIIVGGAAFAQTKTVCRKNILFSLKPNANSSQLFSFGKPVNALNTKSIFLPADFYAKQLGFFCRQEIKMDKAMKIPFRFRLGSVAQCDWLEGKRR